MNLNTRVVEDTPQISISDVKNLISSRADIIQLELVNTRGDAIPYLVRLTRTPCYFGGSRPWFRCGLCGRRAGILVHEDGRHISGKHTPLISSSLFAKCQYLLGKKSNNRDVGRKYDNPDFPLKHTLNCVECGQPLTAQFSNSARGTKHPHYFCKTKGCKLHRKTYRKVDLERDFAAYLKLIKPSKEFVKRFNERFLDRYKHREQDLRGEYLRKSEEVKRLDKDLNFVIEQGKQGVLKGETFRRAVQDAESKLSIAKLDLREVHGEEIDVGLLLAYAEAFIQTLEKVWFDAPFAIKKKIQNFVLPGGLYVAKTREGYFFSNPQIHPLFSLIQDFGVEDSKVVSHRLSGSNFLSDVVQALEDFQAFVASLGEAYLPVPALAY